jgi:hypothetical protein
MGSPDVRAFGVPQQHNITTMKVLPRGRGPPEATARLLPASTSPSTGRGALQAQDTTVLRRSVPERRSSKRRCLKRRSIRRRRSRRRRSGTTRRSTWTSRNRTRRSVCRRSPMRRARTRRSLRRRSFPLLRSSNRSRIIGDPVWGGRPLRREMADRSGNVRVPELGCQRISRAPDRYFAASPTSSARRTRSSVAVDFPPSAAFPTTRV